MRPEGTCRGLLTAHLTLAAFATPSYPLGRILFSVVGPPGIEPGLYEPESHVLPVYYGP